MRPPPPTSHPPQEVGPRAAARHACPVHEGERVILWEPGLEAEGTIVLYGGDYWGYWMAKPDPSTYRDTPLPPEIEEKIARQRRDEVPS